MEFFLLFQVVSGFFGPGLGHFSRLFHNAFWALLEAIPEGRRPLNSTTLENAILRRWVLSVVRFKG